MVGEAMVTGEPGDEVRRQAAPEGGASNGARKSSASPVARSALTA